MNYAAVGQQLQTRSDLFTAGIAADGIVTAIWLVACLVVPGLFARRERAGAPPVDAPTPDDLSHGSLVTQLQSSVVPLRLWDFAGLAS